MKKALTYNKPLPLLSLRLAITSLTLLTGATTCSVNANTLTLPDLPEPVSNNAVAKVHLKGQDYLLSFMGLAEGKTYQDVHNKAWALNLRYPRNGWQPLRSVPHVNQLAGRLAAVAVGIKHKAYLFGGYTVAKDHSEISTQDNYLYRLENDSYERIADMPVAVDDSALVTYQDRFIYLISGWHQHGNVNLVQVYDTKNDTWSQASPVPAPGVFGQAAGIVDNELVVCDGVKVTPHIDTKRSFESSPVCLYGKIEPNNHLRIHWQALPHYSISSNINKQSQTTTAVERLSPIDPDIQHPTAHYRMAATGLKTQQQIVFIGGSDNPYNYDGIGYNGEPSKASNMMYRFDLATHSWLKPISLNQASMDHRGLIEYQGHLLRIGGMLNSQQVSKQVLIDSKEIQPDMTNQPSTQKQ